jgi:Cupin-like domain
MEQTHRAIQHAFDHVSADAAEFAGARGVCQLELYDPESFWNVAFDEHGVRAERGVHDNPTARCGIPSSLFLEFLEGDVDYARLFSSVRVAGDLDLLYKLMLLLSRPHPAVVKTFELAEAHAARHPVHDVQRVRDPDASYVERAAQPGGMPLLIEGVIDSWPARSWTPESLVAHWGELPVFLDAEAVTLGEALARMRRATLCSGESRERLRVPGFQLPRELRADVEPLPYFAREGLADPRFWLAAPQRVTWLHRDAASSFLAHLWGEKRVFLFAPDQAEYLYPRARYRDHQTCQVDPAAPDLTTFPAFQRARSVEVQLKPGELLLIPAGWFHHTIAGDTLTLSISCGYLPDPMRAVTFS